MNALVDVLKTIQSDLPGGLIPAPGGYRCKCPNCIKEGKKPKIAKLYFLTGNEGIVAYCQRCRYSKPLGAFLKDFYPHHAKTMGESLLNHNIDREEKNSRFRYRRPKFSNKERVNRAATEHFSNQLWLEFQDLEVPGGCDRLDRLKRSHKAVQYAEWRKIPFNMLKYLYYVRDFSDLAAKYGYETEKWQVEDRLLIPFWNWEKRITHIQGRSFQPDTNLRYITLDVLKGETKIWGRHRIDPDKPVFITEGPIDGFFVPNCGSTGGSKISADDLKNAFPGVNSKNIIMIFDNEPYNEEIRYEMERKIREGFSILLWDRNKFQQKDINQMVMEGNPNYRMDVIWSMVYHGPMALTKFYEWK